MEELDTTAVNTTRQPFIIKENAPQKPNVPWDEMVKQLQEQFKYWRDVDPEKSEWPPKMPNLPDKHRRIWWDIPPGDILERNKMVRCLTGEKSTGVFYRPGIGYGGALDEILGKIGAYGTLVVTDPVYAGKEMLSLSKGLLPIDYYIRSLALIGAENIEVTLADKYTEPGEVVAEKSYESAEIPAGGRATIRFSVNGVELTIHLLTEDMVEFQLARYDILGLGKPTPHDPANTRDPRNSEEFTIEAIRNLATGGIVDYDEDCFRFLPFCLPPEVLGFKVVHTEDGGRRKIIQKVSNVDKDRLRFVFKAKRAVEEAIGALAGSMPGENGLSYYEDFNLDPYLKDQKKITVDDVFLAYRQNLKRISEFIATLPPQEAQATLERIRFLLIGPLITNGQIDEQKIRDIHKVPDDPDNPTPYNEGSYRRPPYFGSPKKLIEAHNDRRIDIFEYYRRLVNEFYSVFPQFKKSEEV